MKIDQITIDRISLLHPKIREEVEDIYTSQIAPALTGNSFCRFAYTLRTFAEQNDMYAQGRTRLFDTNGKRLGKITNCKGGQSYHQYGVALDIVLIDRINASWNISVDYDGDGKADWMEVVEIFKNNGWTWGGGFKTFKDFPHFEKTFGYNWRDLLIKYNNKDFISGTNYVSI